MELPTGVLTYGFKNANLSDEKQRLIQAIVVSLTYENMKKQLKAIFDSSTSSQSSEGVDIKSKPVFYTNKTNDGESYKGKTNQCSKDGYGYSKFPSGRGRNNRQK